MHDVRVVLEIFENCSCCKYFDIIPNIYQDCSDSRFTYQIISSTNNCFKFIHLIRSKSGI